MWPCSSCCGQDEDESEREPLLPQHRDVETRRQAKLHEKIHTYEKFRALSKGFMPSNDQLIGHLKASLHSSLLNPPARYELSASSRRLLRTTRTWVQQLITFLEEKNAQDQIQDFAWFLYKTDLKAEAQTVSRKLAKGKESANVYAATESLKTIASLLLGNPDFRVLLADVATIARQVLRDTAASVEEVTEQGEGQTNTLATDIEALKAVDSQKESSSSSAGNSKAAGDGKDEINVAPGLGEGVSQVAEDTKSSVAAHTKKETRRVLVNRLRQAIASLRGRDDYMQSLSIVGNVLKRCFHAYVTAGVDSVYEIEDDVQDETARAARNLWLLVSSFGNKRDWDVFGKQLEAFLRDHESDDDLESIINELANTTYQMFSDPEFFDDFEDKIGETRRKTKDIASGSSLGADTGNIIESLERALRSVADDRSVKELTSTSLELAEMLSPFGESITRELAADFTNTLLPLLIENIHFIPIPRFEVSSPAMDLLIENLILEPGHTVNASSFLPHHMRLSTQNDLDINKAKFGAKSTVTSRATLTISGICIAADELGFLLRLHSGLLRMADEGIASFYLDERGIDVTVDIEFGRDRLDELVTVHNVTTHIHRLDYSLRKSKFACLAWIIKPLLRPILKKVLESTMSDAIRSAIEALNRELLFARERLRATRICDPNDFVTFLRAVTARLVPESNPDIAARVGVRPGVDVFKGCYAPGSLVKLFDEDMANADQNIFGGQRHGWRNAIFNVDMVPSMHRRT